MNAVEYGERCVNPTVWKRFVAALSRREMTVDDIHTATWVVGVIDGVPKAAFFTPAYRAYLKAKLGLL